MRPLPGDSFESLTPTPTAASVVMNPDNPPWGIFAAVGFCLLAFVLMAVVQAIMLLAYAVRRGVPLTPQAIGEFGTKDLSAIFVEVVSIIPAHLLTLGLAWALVTRLGKYPFFETLGWKPDAVLTFWRCVVLSVVLWIAGIVIVQLTGNPETALDRLISSSRAAALATAFAATFTAPLVEEIIFRGLLYSALARLTGTVWALTVTFLIFAAIHVPQYWPNFGVIGTILLLSFVLTAIRARTGKLLPCFLVHLFFNGIQSFLIVLNPYLERLTPPKSPAPGALLQAFALLARLHS
ncbi:MAG: CPBP family intramembrane metalloprotease [Acidobacteriota bacterium]|nr:CPBP family intramembrane metalloprotease [Acidobacteriota bacterium]